MSTEDRILKYLKNNREGVMFLDLAGALGIHRHTAKKYAYILEKKGKITIRKVGVAKLCYPRGLIK